MSLYTGTVECKGLNGGKEISMVDDSVTRVARFFATVRLISFQCTATPDELR